MSSAAWDGDDFLRVIRKGLHNPTTAEVSDSDILGHYLQAAQVGYASTYRFPELEAYEDITTVADQAEYSLSATDVLRITEVAGVTTGTIPRLKHTSRGNATRYGTITGSPFRWFESSSSASANTTAITLVPTPSASSKDYRVWYRQIPPVVTASSGGEPASVSVLGEQWNLALALKAIAIGLSIVGRADEVERVEKVAIQEELRAKQTLPVAPEKKWQPETRMAAATRSR